MPRTSDQPPHADGGGGQTAGLGNAGGRGGAMGGDRELAINLFTWDPYRGQILPYKEPPYRGLDMDDWFKNGFEYVSGTGGIGSGGSFSGAGQGSGPKGAVSHPANRNVRSWRLDRGRK